MTYENARRRVTAAAAVLALTVASTGCSLMNPHVTWERPENLANGGKDPNKNTSLPQAIAYAHRAQDEYRRAIGDQSLLTNSLAIPLTAVAAAALGVGITHSSSFSQDFLVGAGLGGATGLALGYWFSSTPRQRVYVAGVKAMTCAVAAVEPLNIGDVDLDRNLSTLNDAILEAGKHSAAVRQAIAELLAITRADTPVIAGARMALQNANAAVGQADEAYASGVKLQLSVARAGPALENAVDRIAALVDDAILSTEPTLAQLPGVISGLAGGAAQFVQLPEPGLFPQVARPTQPAREELDVDENKLRAEVAKLDGAIAAMESAARRVAAIVNSVNEKQGFEALQGCGVDIKAPVTALKTRPSGAIEFQEGKASNRGFTIMGGQHPYFAQFLDDQEGLTVKQPVAFGATVTVSATASVAPNTYNLQISDIAGNSLIVPVTVVPKMRDQAEVSPPGAAGTGDKGDPLVRDMQENLAKFGFDPGDADGVRGGPDSRTNQAIAEFLRTIQSTENANEIGTVEFSDLFVEVVSGIDRNAQNPVGVRNIIIERLLDKLSFKPGKIDGLIDDDAKAAIRTFNNGIDLPAEDKDAMEDLLKRLREKQATSDVAAPNVATPGSAVPLIPVEPADPTGQPPQADD